MARRCRAGRGGWAGLRIQKPTREELDEAHHHAAYDLELHPGEHPDESPHKD